MNTEPLVVPPSQNSGPYGAGRADPVSAPAIHPVVTPIEPRVTPVPLETVPIPPHRRTIAPELTVGSAVHPIGAQLPPALSELPAALVYFPLIATELRIAVTPPGACRCGRCGKSRRRRRGG